MGRPFAYHDLLDMLASPGCAVCALLLRDAERYLDKLIYEFVTDPALHRALRAGRGLCNQHSWQLTQVRGAALGAAILYAAVLDEVQAVAGESSAGASLSGLARRLGGQGAGDALAQRLAPDGPCLACEHVARSEGHYLSAMAAHLHEPELQQAYRRSRGLCLPHVRLLLRNLTTPADVRRLVEIQSAAWARLAEELAEFQRKSDAHYGDEAMGPEATSWLRAIEQIAGARGARPDPTRTQNP